MSTRRAAKAMVTGSNVLLGLSLVVVLVWWELALRLFVAGWVLYGAGYLLGRGAAVEHAALAMPDALAERG